MKDPQWQTRKSAAEALGNFSFAAQDIVPALLKSVDDPNLEVRGALLISLGRLGRKFPEVEDRLNGFLADPDPGTSMKAGVALALMDKANESIIPSVLKALGDKDPTTTGAAYGALTGLTRDLPQKVIPALIDAINTGEEPLLTNAMRFVRNLSLGDPRIVGSLATAYDKVEGKARQQVLLTILQTDPAGQNALPVLAKALKDPDPAVRREALVGTSRFTDKANDLKASLLQSLKDPEPANRVLAVRVLASFRSKLPGAPRELIDLTGDRDVEVKSAALIGLGMYDDIADKAIGILGKTIQDSDPRIRVASATSLSHMGKHTAAVVPILEKALEAEKDQQTKENLAAALYRMGKKTSYYVPPPDEEAVRAVPGEELGRY